MGTSQRRWRTTAVVAAVGLFLVCAAAANAGLTPVNPPKYAGEKSVAEILKSVYGSGVVATRIDDSADQVWSGKVIATRALARFAKFSQGLAFNDGTLKPQFNLTGSGYAVSGSGGSFSSNAFSIVRTGDNGQFSSVEAANRDKTDHMITYLIADKDASVRKYAVFFEDSTKPAGDFDFNDFVAEIKMAAVPLPAAVWAGLVGLSVAGWAVRRARTI